MMHSKRLFSIFVLLVLAASNAVFGQRNDIIKTISKEICKCINKEEVKDQNTSKKCTEIALLNHIGDLIQAKKVETYTDLNIEDVSMEILSYLLKNCKVFSEIMDQDSTFQSVAEKDYSEFIGTDCTGKQTGEFYYVMPDSAGVFNDTTYVTFTESMYLERMDSGKTYSKLKVKWTDKCHFQLVFEESNHSLKKAFSKPGDVFDYQVIHNSNKLMVAKSSFNNQEFYIEFVRIH